MKLYLALTFFLIATTLALDACPESVGYATNPDTGESSVIYSTGDAHLYKYNTHSGSTETLHYGNVWRGLRSPYVNTQPKGDRPTDRTDQPNQP